MSMSVERQSAQYDVFADERWARDRQAKISEVEVADMLHGPSIHAGLNNTRQAGGIKISPHGGGGQFDPHGPYGSGIDSYALPSEPDNYDPDGDAAYAAENGWDREPPEDPYAGHDPHAVPEMPLDQMLDSHDAHARSWPETPPEHYGGRSSFSQARRLQAEDDGLSGTAFNPMLFGPERRMDPRSELYGAEPEHWVTALAAPPAQPAPVTGQVPPGQGPPVWLGHTYVPGHRVGLPWKDTLIPGTVTALEGTNVGVRWDDGQHSVEEPGGIRPLY